MMFRISINSLVLACCIFTQTQAITAYPTNEGSQNAKNQMHAPTIIYVDSSAEVGGTGASWNTAFKYLQDALTLASMRSSADIWVAKGTYYPDEAEARNNASNGDRDASFIMINNVAIYGGFLDGHTAISQRDWVNNETILSGDISNPNAGSYHVIKNDYPMASPLDGSAILSGFIIEGGYGDYAIDLLDDRNYGGGMLNRFSSPMISYCTFRDNRARFGAAICNVESSNPAFTNSLFIYNIAWKLGDAFYSFNSDPSLINCTVTQNKGPNTPGFSDNCIYNLKSDIIITNCILWDNYNEITNNTSTPVVSNSIVQGGYAGGTNIIGNDPLFEDPAEDLSIRICSPAINKGSNNVSVGSLDYGQGSRVLHGTIDIGAYEFVTGVLYVNHEAIGMDDGSSWPNAFDDLQDALKTLSLCESPGQIWIADGTYYPDEGLGQANNQRTSTFKMLPDVQIYGGFGGNETSISQRNWDFYLTILSGDLDQNDGTGSIAGNAYHVINNDYSAASPLTGTARIDGVIVDGGNADLEFAEDEGGGMRNFFSSPTIINCTFANNHARYGAGMYNDSSSLLLTNCKFNGNAASVEGGGIRHSRAPLALTGCAFGSGYAGTLIGAEGGGGLAIKGAHTPLTMVDCHFIENVTTGRGGAVIISSDGVTHSITDCTFRKNVGRFSGAITTYSRLDISDCRFDTNQVVPASNVGVHFFGGGIEIADDSTSIENCIFDGNQTDQYGGAVAATFIGKVLVSNSSFLNNIASYFTFQDPDFIQPSGGAAYISPESEGTFTNCDFHDNYAFLRGGAIYSESDETTVINSRFWNNTTNELGHAVFNNDANSIFTNCAFANNNAYNGSHIIFNDNLSNPVLKNCIIWKFGGPSAPLAMYDDSGSNSQVENCIIQGGWLSGTNILDLDPKFVNQMNGDLHLQACSPAIDYGLNASNQTTIDLAGNPRFHNATNSNPAIIDLGPYEFQEDYAVDCGCPQDLHVEMDISSGTYSAGQSITSDGVLLTGSSVVFSAGTFVELQGDFEVPNTAVLEIILDGCQ